MDEMDRNRRMSRRRMAQISFALLVLKGVLTTAMLLFSDNRLDIANALTAATPATVSITTVFVTIILGYLTASGFDYMNRMKKGNNKEDDR